MSTTRDNAHKTPFLTIKDSNSGRIKHVTFPSEVQIGMLNDASSLSIFGSLSLGVASFTSTESNGGIYQSGNDATIIEVYKQYTPESGILTVYPPRKPRRGQLLIVKDASGTAAEVPIVITDRQNRLIDGEASKSIVQTSGSIGMYWSLRDRWHVIFEHSTGSSGGGAATTLSYVTINSEASLTNERRLTGTSNVTVTDNGAGSTVTLDLSNTGVSAGTYSGGSIQVDAKGRVLSASNGGFPRLIATQVFTGSANLTSLNENTKFIRVTLTGGGGSGASGAGTNTTRPGGSGGGGGARIQRTFDVSELTLPISITVAPVVTGAIAPAGNQNTGLDGATGSSSFFGDLLRAGGGGAGSADTVSQNGGSGGGIAGDGNIGTSTGGNPPIGGQPGGNTTGTGGANHNTGYGGSTTNNQPSGAGGMANYGGAAGGNSNTAGATGGAGGRSIHGGSGGGAGGRAGSAVTNAGGDGGLSGFPTGTETSGGGGAGGAAGGTTGSDGTAGAAGNRHHAGSGGGGGGGGTSASAGTQAVGGRGGDGGTPGGGGGGGGAAHNSAATTNIQVGAGGDGARGECTVEEFG